MAFLDYSGLSHFLDKLKTLFIPLSQKGANNGVATLGNTGKVPSSQLDISANEVSTSAISGQAAVENALEYLDNQNKTLDSEAVKSVNGKTPDSHGRVEISQVPYAEDIVTTEAQQSSAEYIMRTTGGEASLSDGAAKLDSIRGRRIHTGQVDESIAMTVNAVEREPDPETGITPDPITATLDHDTFVAYVQSSGTITLTYSSSWSASPALYGITVTGTPVNGDEIIIVYVKEERGTITQSTPTAFKSTGWNLYDNTLGYAKVLKYSDTYGFMIGGTYTAVQFSETESGEKNTITPDSNGLFTVPSDGYVWVTGGNTTDTFVLMTWSDWTEGYEGSFTVYTESVIDLTSAMTNFPYGLMQVGTYTDELNIRMGIGYSRVERRAYNAENLAYAKASGRVYEYDTNYIYIQRAEDITYDIDTDGAHIACDHGYEIVVGTTIPEFVQTLYGKNLVDYLQHDIPTTLESLKTDVNQYEATLYKGDLNSAPHGRVYTNTGVSNQPDTSYAYWIVDTIIYSSNHACQTAYMRTSAANPTMFYRAKSSGVWGSWNQVALNTNVEKRAYQLTLGDSDTFATMSAALDALPAQSPTAIFISTAAMSLLTDGSLTGQSFRGVVNRSGTSSSKVFDFYGGLGTGNGTGHGVSFRVNISTGVAQYNDPYQNIMNTLGEFAVLTKSCPASGSTTITKKECQKGILVTFGGSLSRMGVWLFYNASNGYVKQVTSGDAAAGSMTVTSDGTTTTISNSASAAATCFVLVLDV